MSTGSSAQCYANDTITSSSGMLTLDIANTSDISDATVTIADKHQLPYLGEKMGPSNSTKKRVRD